MFEASKANTVQENSKRENNKSVKVIVAATVCVILLLGLLGIGYFVLDNKDDMDNVSIVEVASLEALRAIPAEEFISASDRLYKVGDDYYSYFPSTGKIELVSTVKDYDKMSLTLLESMLGDVQTANVDSTNALAAGTDVAELFTNSLAERTQYIQYELDNCNANLVLAANDSNLLSYKTKLESELMQLVAYQAVSAEQLQFFLQCLGTEEADKVLAEKISKILDKQFVTLVNEYNISAGTIGKEELERLLETQTEAIQILTEKYNTIEKTLVEKRVALDAGAGVLSEESLQTIYNQLDTYVEKYLSDYNTQVTELAAKLSALEQLYGSMGSGSTDGTDTDVLLAIRNQYVTLKNEQAALEERIKYLEGVVGSGAKVDTTENTNKSDNSVSDALSSELNSQKAQFDAISDILDNAGLDNINKLVEEQERLQGTIKELEDALKAADALIDTEQTNALTEAKTALEELINSTSAGITTDTENKLNELTGTLTENISALGSSTTEALDALKDALNNLNDNQGNQNDAFSELISNLADKLDNDINEQNNAREELERNIQDLITETTESQNELRRRLAEELRNELNATNTDLQTKYDTTQDAISNLKDIIKELEEALRAADALIDSEQTKALTEAKTALEELINSTATSITKEIEIKLNEVTVTLNANITALSSSTTEALDALREALDNLKDGQGKQNVVFSDLISNLADKLDTDINEQNTAREELERNIQDLIAKTTASQNELRTQLESEMRDELNATNTDLQNKYLTTQDAIEKLKESSANGLSETRKNLTDALETLKQNNSDDLAALNTEIQNALNALNNDLNAKYIEVTKDISDINTQIVAMKQVQDEYGTRIGNLVTGLTDATDRISALETGLTNTQDALKALTERVKELEENPYVLPPATRNDLGGVMVDGETIAVDEDGTLHVLVSYNTLDEFYPIGVNYPEITTPRTRIKPYCIKLKEEHITSETVTVTDMASKPVQTDTRLIPEVTDTRYVVTAVTITYNSGGTFEGHEVSPSTTTSNPHIVATLPTQMAFEQYKASFPNWPIIASDSGSSNTIGGMGRSETTVTSVDTETYVIRPAREEPVYTTKWYYSVENPFAATVYTSDAVYESSEAVPTMHTFTGSRYDIKYVGSNKLNALQLQKLYNAGLITNTTDEQTYLRQLYTKYGTDYIYCGIPTEPIAA